MGKKPKKTKKVEEIPPHIQKFKEEYERYQRNYTIISWLWFALTAVVWYFTNHFYGATVLAFGLWSSYWYKNGARENCVDEYEYAYPEDGFRRMAKSWPWFIILDLVAFFICDACMPWLLD